jgi:hypothetical protein
LHGSTLKVELSFHKRELWNSDKTAKQNPTKLKLIRGKFWFPMVYVSSSLSSNLKLSQSHSLDPPHLGVRDTNTVDNSQKSFAITQELKHNST